MVPTRQCERCRSQVSLDLDARLSELEAASMRRHLAACADCRTFAADVRELTTLLRAEPQLSPDVPTVVQRVRRGHRGMAGALAGLAATAAVAALALSSGLNGSSQSGPSPGVATATAGGNVDLMTLREERIAQLHRSLTDAVAGRTRGVEFS
jgi:predicted anti-sigma-YlaC factor YlaD